MDILRNLSLLIEGNFKVGIMQALTGVNISNALMSGSYRPCRCFIYITSIKTFKSQTKIEQASSEQSILATSKAIDLFAKNYLSEIITEDGKPLIDITNLGMKINSHGHQETIIRLSSSEQQDSKRIIRFIFYSLPERNMNQGDIYWIFKDAENQLSRDLI